MICGYEKSIGKCSYETANYSFESVQTSCSIRIASLYVLFDSYFKQYMPLKYVLLRLFGYSFRLNLQPENTNHRGKYHCMTDLLFDWFELDQTSEADANSTNAEQLKPNKIKRRLAFQLYFPLS